MKTPTAVLFAVPLRSVVATLLITAPLVSQDLLNVCSGQVAGEALGVVTDVGDLNGDGRTDLALGSPEDALGRGRVTVVSGANWQPLFSATGTLPGERFGAAISGAGDV